jgi:alpha-L-fucosidase
MPICCPMPNGEIQPEHKASLGEMGKWLDENGETIYGTRGGPMASQDWGVSTQKGKKVYLHVLDPKEALFIRNFKPNIKAMTFYKNKSPVDYDINKYGMLLALPEDKREPIDTIIEITLK